MSTLYDVLYKEISLDFWLSAINDDLELEEPFGSKEAAQAYIDKQIEHDKSIGEKDNWEYKVVEYSPLDCEKDEELDWEEEDENDGWHLVPGLSWLPK